MKAIFVFAPLAMTWSVLAGSWVQAGVDSGGGGGAFVCRDSATGEVQNAELLDLWEGANIAGYAIPQSDEAVDAQISRALAKLSAVDQGLYNRVVRELTAIRANARELPPGVVIEPPADALNKYGKKGCPLEGMLLYDGTYGRLEINGGVFSKLLNTTQVAAAWTHEAIYKVYRDVLKAADSSNARRLNACLFSTDNCLGLASSPASTSGKYRCEDDKDGIEFVYNPQAPNDIGYSRLGADVFGDPIALLKPEIQYGAYGNALSQFGYISAHIYGSLSGEGPYLGPAPAFKLTFSDGRPGIDGLPVNLVVDNLSGTIYPSFDYLQKIPAFRCAPFRGGVRK